MADMMADTHLMAKMMADTHLMANMMADTHLMANMMADTHLMANMMADTHRHSRSTQVADIIAFVVPVRQVLTPPSHPPLTPPSPPGYWDNDKRDHFNRETSHPSRPSHPSSGVW